MNDSECIDLLRGDTVVTSLVGAQGGLRETRLTAFLGYLIALAPEKFIQELGFRGSPRSVSLEVCHEDGRSDIIVDTSLGRGVIEAKVTATDPGAQVQRYSATWRVLLTQYLASSRQRKRHRCRYITWDELLGRCVKDLGKHHNSKVRFVANDLLRYLREHGMVSDNDPKQVYAREINERKTLAAFLKCRLYFCDYEKGGRLPKMSYFAPHFGQKIANEYPGIRVGISYIARIIRVEVGGHAEGATDFW